MSPVRRWPLDPDPLTVEPEPVRRRRSSDDGPSPGHVVLAAVSLVLALLIVVATYAVLAAPRSGPDPTAPRPGASDAAGPDRAPALAPERASGQSQSGAPRLEPEAGLGAPQRSGWATWCAPTPKYCHGWGGRAMVAAVPSFRYGDEPYTVQVTAFEGGRANSVLVTVVSFCACGDRGGIPTVIDLSPYAFQQLAPLRTGKVRVVVDHVREGSHPTGPPTDVQEAGR